MLLELIDSKLGRQLVIDFFQHDLSYYINHLQRTILTMLARTQNCDSGFQKPDSSLYHVAFCSPLPNQLRAPSSSSSTISERRPALSMSSTAPSSSKHVARRAFLNAVIVPLVMSPLIALADSLTDPYDAIKSRRLIDTGRPTPDGEPPKFSSSQPTFKIDDRLEAQDIATGTGDAISSGDLIVGRWIVRLDDGTTIDDTNLSLASMFRPGAHAVPPGIEDAFVGMRLKGERRIYGSAERILSNISEGYDIGERSLVPNGSKLYVELFVDSVNPFGK